MNQEMKNILYTLGRICLSFIFIFYSINSFSNWDSTLQVLINTLTDILNKSSLPCELYKFFSILLNDASLICIGGIILTGVGGCLVLLGLKTRIGAILLIIFLISKIILHAFWYYDSLQEDPQMMLFLTNLGLLGGLLILIPSPNYK